VESPTVTELIELLIKGKKSEKEIIDVLRCIIQTYMMYGGSVSDSVAYQVDLAKKEQYL
jgi:hypothetical protein